MAGVPHHSLDEKSRVLLANTRNVSVVDQVQSRTDAPVEELVERCVTRLITPGTLTDDALLDTSVGNYVAAVTVPASVKEGFGVAMVDVCTVEVRATTCDSLAEVGAEMRAVRVAEVIVAAGVGGTALEKEGEWTAAEEKAFEVKCVV